MKVEKREKRDYRVSQWSGGTTTEFLLFPESASYAARNFLWRVSSATVELAESDFTLLPDYRRYLTPLSGDLELSRGGAAFASLPALDVLAFDGGEAVKSRGQVTDFNLMLRKGAAEGGMATLQLRADREVFLSTMLENAAKEAEVVLLYCFSGAFRLQQRDGLSECRAGACLVLQREAGDRQKEAFAFRLQGIEEQTTLALVWMQRKRKDPENF